MLSKFHTSALLAVPMVGIIELLRFSHHPRLQTYFIYACIALLATLAVFKWE